MKEYKVEWRTILNKNTNGTSSYMEVGSVSGIDCLYVEHKGGTYPNYVGWIQDDIICYSAEVEMSKGSVERKLLDALRRRDILEFVKHGNFSNKEVKCYVADNLKDYHIFKTLDINKKGRIVLGSAGKEGLKKLKKLPR